MEDTRLCDVYGLLRRVGVPANYTGFFHTACAVLLAMEHPEWLAFVRRDLFPKVAERYHTDRETVERGVLAASRSVWRNDRKSLERMARKKLLARPAPAQFLAIVAAYLRAAPRHRAAQ